MGGMQAAWLACEEVKTGMGNDRKSRAYKGGGKIVSENLLYRRPLVGSLHCILYLASVIAIQVINQQRTVRRKEVQLEITNSRATVRFESSHGGAP